MIKPKSPIAVQFEITDNCNHKCRHCYNFWRDDSYKNEPISSHHVEKIKKISKKIIDADIFHVILTGGEPFLFGNKLEEILCLYSENNVGIRINSNATFHNNSIVDILKNYYLYLLKHKHMFS